MNRTIQYWVVIFIVQVLFIAWYKGLLTPEPNHDPDALVMTAKAAELTKNAIEIVRKNVVAGDIPSTELALSALSSLLPGTERERVMDALGKPDFEFFCGALDVLEKQIEVRRK
jgi:hypothetical protein